MLLDGTWDGKGRLLGPLLVVCLGLLLVAVSSHDAWIR